MVLEKGWNRVAITYQGGANIARLIVATDYDGHADNQTVLPQFTESHIALLQKARFNLGN
jgi:hypothetical protein